MPESNKPENETNLVAEKIGKNGTSHYVALVNRSNATRGSWRAVEKNWCIGSMEVTVFRGVRLARASHPHTCAHKYTARVLTISTGYAAPSCERLGRYVVTMKGVAFEDEKLSPVRFILPLAVARCREWRTPFSTPALRLLLNNESSFFERATKDCAIIRGQNGRIDFPRSATFHRGLWLILFIFSPHNDSVQVIFPMCWITVTRTDDYLMKMEISNVFNAFL